MTPRECQAWEALQGRKIADGAYLLQVRTYRDNLRAAVHVIRADDHDLECKMTVNLDRPLGEGEFFVRLDESKYAKPVFDAIVDEGIAKPTGITVPAGYVEKYAEVWRLCAVDRWTS